MLQPPHCDDVLLTGQTTRTPGKDRVITMLDQTGLSRIPYEEVMQAIGYFIDQKSLREITLVELNEGILIKGISYTADRTGYQSDSQSFLFTHEDLERIVNENYERRKQAEAAAVAAALQQQQQQGQKGGLFNR
jgi:hypothetical protein